MKLVAYIGGTFDLFHVGHVKLFQTTKKDCGHVVVSVNTDEFNYRYKGHYPIIPRDQRIDMLRACRYVDQVIVNVGDEDSKPAILSIMPDFIVHGTDMSRETLMRQMNITDNFLEEYNIELRFYPYSEKVNTSAIREEILKRKWGQFGPRS